MDQWEVKSDRVVRTWNAPEAKTVAERKEYLNQQVSQQYRAQLAEGFTDASSTTWAGTQDARNKMLELASGIGVSDRLPKGNSSITLKDRDGTPHDLTKSEVQQLANDALDFKYDADARRDELLSQIEAATSQSDLDAIDIMSGWP